MNIKPALNLIPLEPDFTEDDSSELMNTTPTEPNPTPICDKDSSMNDQGEMELQQIGITDNKKKITNLPPKILEEDTIEKAIYSPASELQEKGITEAKTRKMNLRSKKSKSALGESGRVSPTITQDNNNTRYNQKQKADSAKPELDTILNIKPVKVVLKKLSDK